MQGGGSRHCVVFRPLLWCLCSLLFFLGSGKDLVVYEVTAPRCRALFVPVWIELGRTFTLDNLPTSTLFRVSMFVSVCLERYHAYYQLYTIVHAQMYTHTFTTTATPKYLPNLFRYIPNTPQGYIARVREYIVPRRGFFHYPRVLFRMWCKLVDYGDTDSRLITC